MNSSRSTLTINLAALGRNVEALRAMANGAKLAPVVKANAYGLGDVEVTRFLVEACGIDTVFVATAAESKGLVEALDQPPKIFVLNGYDRAEWPPESNIIPVLNTENQARSWQADGGHACAIGVDIGMNRLGFSPEEPIELARGGVLNRDATELCVMHLSHSGDLSAPENAVQIQRYKDNQCDLKQAFPNMVTSLSASGGLFLHHDAEEWVARPGVALYGGAPDGTEATTLETVATWTAPVLAIRDVNEGDTVGYNGRWTAPTDSRVAILGAGYADGYHRVLTNKGVVFLGGAECPVVGTVSMDLIAVDVTNAGNINEGDRAELFGDHIKIDRLAALADTISYELLTSIGNRVARQYLWQD